MSISEKIMPALKEAMKNKNQIALQSIRAIKSEFLLAQTSGKQSITGEDEIKILQKLVKQRKDSAALYKEQGREDLADPEIAQAKIIEGFLPAQLSDEELEHTISKIIEDIGANGMKDMGKVMGITSKKLAGKADGKRISNIVKKQLI